MFEDDLNRAVVLINRGNKTEAREILKQIVKDDPQNEKAWAWLADTYPDNPNRYAILRKCLRHNPNSQIVQKWLTTVKFDNDLNSVIDLLLNGKKFVAREILEHIVQDDPQNDTAWIWLANSYPDTPKRIEVLQECLKHNPNSRVTQRWLATIKTEKAMLPNPGQQDLPAIKSTQSEQIQENDGKSSGSSDDSNETDSKRKTRNFGLFLLGFIILGSLGLFGGSMLQKQGISRAKMARETIFSLPTATQVPTSTQVIPVVQIIETPTLTSIPTITLTSSVTSTPLFIPATETERVITSSIPSTATATETLTPISALAKQAIGVALNRGFVPASDACGQYQSCQAFLSEEPYMLMVIMNNGLVTITLDYEAHSGQNPVQTPETAALNNGTELLWYDSVIGDIYNSFSSDFRKDTAVVMDRVMKYGSYDWESYYGYKITGTESTDQKTILTITPP